MMRIGPKFLLHLFDAGRGWRIAQCLVAAHPGPVSRDRIMAAAGISVDREGALSAYAGFQFQILRFDAWLEKYGWTVARSADETYQIKPRLSFPSAAPSPQPCAGPDAATSLGASGPSVNSSAVTR